MGSRTPARGQSCASVSVQPCVDRRGGCASGRPFAAPTDCLCPSRVALPAGRKKRKGASDSDSDGMESPDDQGMQALAVSQPQQSLADLAQAFMQMLSTQDPRPKSRSGRGRRDGAGSVRRSAGPIIEEAPSTGGGFAVPTTMPAIPTAGGAGGMHSAAAATAGDVAPMMLSSTPVVGYGGLPMVGPFDGVPGTSAAAAAAFNTAGPGAGLPSFVPVDGGAGANAVLPLPLPVPTPNGVAVPPLTDSNPIVELPDLDSLGLGNVDLVSGTLGTALPCLLRRGLGPAHLVSFCAVLLCCFASHHPRAAHLFSLSGSCRRTWATCCRHKTSSCRPPATTAPPTTSFGTA